MNLRIQCALGMEKEQFLILCLIIRCTLLSQKYGNHSQASFIQTTLFRQIYKMQKQVYLLENLMIKLSML